MCLHITTVLPTAASNPELITTNLLAKLKTLISDFTFYAVLLPYASTALYFDRGAHFATLLWLSIEYLLDAALALACELTELPFPVQSAGSQLTTTLARLPSSVAPASLAKMSFPLRRSSSVNLVIPKEEKK